MTYELPTVPGLYVAHSAVQDGNPAGAVIWVLDADDGEWYEHDVWNEVSKPVYPQGLEHYIERCGWRMVRLVPEVV